MKYRSLEEISRAYWRVKLRSIGVFFLALLFWCGFYGGTLYLIVRWVHPLSQSIALPLGLGFLLGGFTFGVTVLYRFNRPRLVRCPHCSEQVSEIEGGGPNPICQRCGKSIIESG